MPRTGYSLHEHLAVDVRKKSSKSDRVAFRNFSEISPILPVDKSVPFSARRALVKLRARCRAVPFGGPSPISKSSSPRRSPGGVNRRPASYGGPRTGSRSSDNDTTPRLPASNAASVLSSKAHASRASANSDRLEGSRRNEPGARFGGSFQTWGFF